MKELLTRSGYRCDLCLAYKENIENEDQREVVSDGWEKCFGFRIPANQIYCEGCLSEGNPKLIYTECPVRACVIELGLNNCSECDEYPCEKFKQREVTHEKIIKKNTFKYLGNRITNIQQDTTTPKNPAI